ncbi:MAG: ABC transporter ATP-binding protein [Endomicrobiaceae bacterium]|nr:ABC transporter ATP-binding protein [Endomicrobiaceae bacterium]
MNYKRLIAYIKPYKVRFMWAMVCMCVFAAMTSGSMLLIKVLFDKVLTNNNTGVADTSFITKMVNFTGMGNLVNTADKMDMLLIIIVLIPIVFSIKSLADYGKNYLLNYIGQNIIRVLRDQLYGKLIHLSHDFYVRNSSSKIMSRVTNDINALYNAVLKVPSCLIKDGLTVIAMIILLFYLHWKFAFIAIVIVPVVTIPLIQFARKMRKASKEGQIQMAEIYSSLQEMLSGFSVIKAFCQEEHEKNKFKKDNDAYYHIQQRLLRVEARSSPIMEALGSFVAAVVLWFGGKEVLSGQWAPGSFIAFFGALFSIYQPLKSFAQLNSTIQQAITASERVFEILDEKPTIFDKLHATVMPKFSNKIEYKNVSFSYGTGKQILNSINVTIPSGKTFAFVGASGSGKTTIANLLLRFYDVKGGEILIDGKNINDVKINSLRAQIGVVSQDVLLFNESVRYNIAYGKMNASEEEIESVAKAANAHSFISKMPDKYNTIVGERGIKLSGGEKQRIAIARAMLKNPPILILDEATSALDTESEKLVQEAIENLMRNRTVILIAHRLTTVKNSDKIIVIDRGNIAETGTHDELLLKNGIYTKLHDMQ